MLNIMVLFYWKLAAMSLLSVGVDSFQKGTFSYDLDMLMDNTQTILLKRGDAQVAVVGDYQGRVMTSTSQGLAGRSYGWVGHDYVSTGSSETGMNLAGGEDRLWFGPEFGPYSIFFKPGDSMMADNVVVPEPLNSEPFDLLEYSDTSVVYGRQFKLTNYQGYQFELDVERTINLFSQSQIEQNLNISLTREVTWVGFEAVTKAKNAGTEDWSKSNGLLSVWDIGAFPPSPHTVVVIPTRNNPQEVTSYWRQAHSDRLKIKNGVVFYRGDGNFLHKIGIKPHYTTPVFGSYDSHSRVLTVVQFDFSNEATYVNSQWEYEADPYDGDVINVFNDGPINGGKPFGPFYELESSSSARELKIGESLRHTHATYHFEGDQASLNKIATSLFGVGLKEIENAFHQDGSDKN